MKNSKTMPRQRCRCSGPLFLIMLAVMLSAPVGIGQNVAGTAHVTTAEKGRMPILVLTDSRCAKNPFGRYLPEILRSEGLVEFEVRERTALSAIAERHTPLSAYDIVLMAEMDLNATEERLLRDYVSGGGLLVAMRPDVDLADLFGIRIAEPRTEKLLQYFAVDSAAAGRGTVESAMQYHGEAATYSLNGATPLAHLYDDRSTASSHPAVSSNRWGKGRAVAFAFDLAKSVVLMRQGNPQWQDTEGDTKKGYRPMDMFMRINGETYFDPGRLRIPQADEKQRFLANIVVRLAEKPLPRMWYLPGIHKVIVVNTGDAESNYEEQLDPAFDACASYGGRFTAYLRGGEPNLGIEKTTVQKEAAWRAAGHEVGVHMFSGGVDGAGTNDAMNRAYGKIVGDLKRKFGHGARTARNHTIDWTGWVEMAAIEAKFGTKMDLNYYHYITFGTPITTSGYFNGTGLPQRLIDAEGRVIPIYQATTQWPDEWFADYDMTAEQTVKIITEMIQAAQSGYYSAFVNNIHQCRYNGNFNAVPSGIDQITPVWPGKVWAYCRDNKIPSWSAEMLLDFVEARNAARFEKITWRTDSKRNTSELSFNFHNPTEDRDLTVMLPRQWTGRTLKSVAADGKTLDVTVETIKGIQYVMFSSKAAKAHIVAHYAMAGSKR
jgi:hypothetical protein